MAEPKEKATRLLTVTSDVLRWSVRESRIGNLAGESYALDTKAGLILIDPLPLTAPALTRLEKRGPVAAILLTIQSHQRSSWRYAKRFDVLVYAPKGSKGLEGKWRPYAEGDALPGGVTAIALPGPAFSGHGLIWSSAEGRMVFSGDIVSAHRKQLQLVPDEYMDSPKLARESVRKLIGQRLDWLCPGHGAPLQGNVKRALQAVLKRDATA